MAKRNETGLNNLPACAAEFIKLVIKKMRYRKKVRRDVQAELTAHFEDELRDCKTDEEKEQKTQQLIEQFGDAKLLGILLRRAKKRCQPLWRTIIARTFQTAGVLILCFITYTIWFFAGKPVVTTDYLAELNHLARPVADDNLNAAPFFEQAAVLCPNIPDEKNDFWQNSFVDANETERQVISDWVKLCDDSLNLIAQGAEKPYYWRHYKTGGDPDDDGSMMGVILPNLREFLMLTTAICFRAQIKASKGEYSSAFDDLITCYKFGRLVSQGGETIVEQLDGMAIQGMVIRNIREMLSNYPVGAEELAVLQADFTKALAGQEFGIRLLFEKLAAHDEIQRCFTEDRLGSGHLYLKRLFFWMVAEGFYSGDGISSATSIVKILFFHQNKTETRQEVDEYYDFFEKTSQMSPAELKRKSIDLDEQTLSMIKGNVFLDLLMPALKGFYRSTYRFKADVQSTPVIIAALRFKIDTGKYPENMAELKQVGYIKEIPIDPWSDKPLVYKRTNDNFTLYSVGYNFEDDGGQIYRDERGRVDLWEGDAVFWPVQK